jgi:hypothetical protein
MSTPIISMTSGAEEFPVQYGGKRNLLNTVLLNEFPKRLFAFTPGINIIASMIRQRKIMLARTEGQVEPAGMAGLIVRQINLESLPRLLASLEVIRDNTKVASLILAQMSGWQLSKVKAHDLQNMLQSELVITAELRQAFPNISEALLLALIQTAHSGLEEWQLVRSFTRRDLHGAFIALYDSVLNEYVNTPAEQGNALQIRTSSADAFLKALGNIRLLDCLYVLLTVPEALAILTPPAINGTGSSAFESRMQALSRLAGWAHGLITIPNFVKIIALKYNFEQLQKLVGKITLPYSRVEERYNEYVIPYDVWISDDFVRQIFSKLSDRPSDMTGGTVTGLISELVPVSITKVMREAAELPRISGSNPIFERIAGLDTDLLLASVQGTLMAGILTSQRLAMGDAYEAQMAPLLAQIAGEMTDFLPKNIHTEVKNIITTPAFEPLAPLYFTYSTMHAHALSFSDRATVAATSVPASTMTDAQLKNQFLSFRTLTSVIDSSELVALVDEQKAAALAHALRMSDKMTLVPSGLALAPEKYTHEAIKTSPYTVLEAIMRQPASVITLTFNSSYAVKAFATLLSSFAVVYAVPTDSRADLLKPDGTYEGGVYTRVLSADEVARYCDSQLPMQGWGFPYGLTYAALSSYAGSHAFIFGNVIIRLLNRVPLPGENLSNGNFDDFNYYRFFTPANGAPANGSQQRTVQGSVSRDYVQDGDLYIKYFVFGKAFVNFALAPPPLKPLMPPALLTRRVYFLNDIIVSPAAYGLPPSAVLNEGADVRMLEKSWGYMADSGTTRLIVPPHTIGTTPTASLFTISGKEKDLTLVKEIAEAVKEAKEEEKTPSTPETVKPIPESAITELQPVKRSKASEDIIENDETSD